MIEECSGTRLRRRRIQRRENGPFLSVRSNSNKLFSCSGLHDSFGYRFRPTPLVPFLDFLEFAFQDQGFGFLVFFKSVKDRIGLSRAISTTFRVSATASQRSPQDYRFRVIVVMKSRGFGLSPATVPASIPLPVRHETHDQGGPGRGKLATSLVHPPDCIRTKEFSDLPGQSLPAPICSASG